LHKSPIQSLFIGSKLIKLPSCHSTSRVASDLLSDNSAVHGTVVITDNQTDGKGQRGNRWESEPGKNLTFSVLIKPSFLPVSKQFELTVVTSLALVTTLKELGLPNVWVKWPNDIYASGGKIAGILIENVVRASQLEWAILGIGLNVNQMKFEVTGATSMKQELGVESDLNLVLDKLLKQLNHYYQMAKWGQLEKLRELYTKSLMGVGRPRMYKDVASGTKCQGVIQRVTTNGRLVVRSGEQDLVFDFKQLEFAN
jgi:BirA family biotin operon repressor/biotin-[acetyl-CoA-carboxylase] ligase